MVEEKTKNQLDRSTTCPIEAELECLYYKVDLDHLLYLYLLTYLYKGKYISIVLLISLGDSVKLNEIIPFDSIFVMFGPQ